MGIPLSACLVRILTLTTLVLPRLRLRTSGCLLRLLGAETCLVAWRDSYSRLRLSGLLRLVGSETLGFCLPGGLPHVSGYLRCLEGYLRSSPALVWIAMAILGGFAHIPGSRGFACGLGLLLRRCAEDFVVVLEGIAHISGLPLLPLHSCGLQ